MPVNANESILAARQIPKLKSLLKKYRQARTIQSGLLQLSELASSVTDMNSFYAELQLIIKTILVTDSFHITLINNQQNLSLAYSHNPNEKKLIEIQERESWENSLTGLVFTQGKAIRCNAKEIDEGFHGKMLFDEVLIHYKIKTDYLDTEIQKMINTMNAENIPNSHESCENCAYARQRSVIDKL